MRRCRPTRTTASGPLSPHQVNRRLQVLAAALGLEGVSSHSGRRGLTSELVRRGAEGYPTTFVLEYTLTARPEPACRPQRRSVVARSPFRRCAPGPAQDRRRQGPSPRVRGSPPRLSADVTAGGSIPACAGKPLVVDGMVMSGRVHPRVCGEAHYGEQRRPAGRGPSPRVRGSR